MNPKCKAGQVHEKKPESPKKSKLSQIFGGKKSKQQAPAPQDICICQECGSRACVPCDRPDHTPETCEDYQSRIKGRTDEDDKSRALLLKISRPCPKCNKPIQKAGGCNSMMCAGCHSNFCWECLEVFTRWGCKCTLAAVEAQERALEAHERAVAAGRARLAPGQ
jgi:ariadne-1